jgi:hypothetical protein
MGGISCAIKIVKQTMISVEIETSGWVEIQYSIFSVHSQICASRMTMISLLWTIYCGYGYRLTIKCGDGYRLTITARAYLEPYPQRRSDRRGTPINSLPVRLVPVGFGLSAGGGPLRD